MVHRRTLGRRGLKKPLRFWERQYGQVECTYRTIGRGIREMLAAGQRSSRLSREEATQVLRQPEGVE